VTVYFDEIEREVSATLPPLDIAKLPKRSGAYRNFLKRAFDLTAILIGAPVVLPLVGVLALVVARDGHNPFYRNTRVGKSGKSFKMLKLRTMVPDADCLLSKHLASNSAAREEWAATQKLKDDPRITKFGKFLRKSSIDELPQLWNVVTGDMSLVGPRPMLPEQREMYPGLAYYFLRPGITGLWQVSDRNKVQFAKRADFDREYDQKVSFTTDVHLLVKTFGVVLRGTGY